MTAPFTFYLRVRYAECDAQSVVFNGKYAEYADVAATEYTRAIWGDYSCILDRGVDNQVVNLNIDWYAPAHFDDVLAIEVQTSHIGNTSYSLEMVVRRFEAVASQSNPLAIAKWTYVMVDTDAYSKISIPSDLRAALQRGAPGKRVNQAGCEIE